MIALYTHATGCFVRDSVNPDYINTFPFYSTDHCLGYESWRFIIWPGIFYFGERVYREIRARRATTLERVLVHPSGAMEFRINKPSFKYTAGQWLFIQIPEVSRFQWHPVRYFDEIVLGHSRICACFLVHYHFRPRRPVRLCTYSASRRLDPCCR